VGAGDEALGTAVLAAVDRQAWRYGVRPGQRVAEATAFVGQLQVVRLAHAEIVQALAQIAELSLGYGTSAATGLDREALGPGPSAPLAFMSYPGGAGAGPEDTVWLDITGCARLRGGEDLLCDELRERVLELGYRARLAIADGPRVAQAVARWAREELIVPPGKATAALGALPIAALPLEPGVRTWLGKLGIWCIADLHQLDRAKLASRLGRGAQDLLAFCAGQDDVPLRPYSPPRTIVEQMSFDHALDSTEPLLFVLGGLMSRAALRLGARGEATGRLVVELRYDRSVARLVALDHGSARLELELPLPLAAAEDLLRAVRAKLETLTLEAPVCAVELTLDRLVAQARTQLDLGRRASIDPNALATLLSELSATLGAARVGVLRTVDSHRPEAQSQLVAVKLNTTQAAPLLLRVPERRPEPWLHQATVTRLLPKPVLVGRIGRGQILALDHGLYVIDALRLEARLDQVEWWTPEPVARDYARAWLHTAGALPQQHEHAEAWVYVDRLTGRAFVHGWFE